MNYHGINDNYLPTVPKLSSQQYDNYQIYDLVCVDKSPSKKFKNFLAIQAYSPYPINSNFIDIVAQYK